MLSTRQGGSVSNAQQFNDEIHLKVLDIIDEQPQISQRELSRQLNVSLGKVNYCLKALLDKGLLKANNFKNSKNKRAYIYVLTPKGIEEKTLLTAKFLKYKMAEFEVLKQEIADLKQRLN